VMEKASMKNSFFMGNNNLSLFFKSDPKLLKVNHVVEKYYAMTRANNFCIYERTEDNSTLIAYPTNAYSVEVKNLVSGELIKELSGHYNYVTSVRHYILDKVDYLLSSSMDRTVILWNMKNLCCQITIRDCHKSTFLFSAHVVRSASKEYYILTSVADPEPIKVCEIKTGSVIKSINTGKDKVAFLNSWKRKDEKNYVISCNNNNVKFYDFSSGKQTKSFSERDCENTWHYACFVVDSDQGAKSTLYESDKLGYIRLWDIESENLLKSIKTSDCLVGITIWNDQHLLAACKGGVRVIDLVNESETKFLGGNENFLFGTIVKVNHVEYGECIMTSSGGSYKDNKISLWKI